MSNILKPKAMPASAAAQSKPNPFLDSPSEPAVNANISKPNPFFDSPISDEYSGFSSQDSPQDVMRTPGSAAGSAFTPVKPSVHIKGWDTPEGSPKSDKENSTSIPPSTNNDVVEEKPEPSSNKVKSSFGEKTALFREQVRKNVPKPKVNSNKVKEALEGKKAMLRKNMEQVKKNVPKPMNMNHLIHAPKKNCVDLADLSIVTISLVPRMGVGMRSGRKPFERMRTSLMLHLMQEIKTKSWTKHEVTDGENGKLDQDELASKLNNMMYDCIANVESTFVEKSQDIVKIARETVEEIKDSTDKSFSKSEVGRRNLLSAKFFSSGYREIVADENLASNMKDGMSLMVVASAYYALGKFEWALEVYQRAGVELKKKIAASSPEYIVYCTKLFNNMACVYFEMKKYDKAMKTWQRALELCNDENEDYAFWTASILDQVSIMNNMAYLLIKFRLFDDATDLIDSSFELQQIIPEFSNQIMNIATLSTMGFIYYQTKQHKASFDTYKACVQLQENTTQHTERDKVDVLTKMSANCKKMKDHEKRVLILRCILVYQQCYLLEDDDEIWETNAAMAESLQEYADAGGDHI